MPVETSSPDLPPASLSVAARGRPAIRPPILDRHQYLSAALVVAAVAIFVPNFVHGRSTAYLADLWLVYSVAAIGFYWVFGLAGRFAFCHTFSMALGAYLSAWTTRHIPNVWVGLLAAIVGTGIIMTLVGWAIARAKEFYFAVATLALTQVGLTVFTQWTGFTGSSGNVDNIRPMSVAGHKLSSDHQVFWLLLAVFAAVLVLAVFIDRSPLRRELIAGRDNPTVARTLGVPVVRLQLLFFVLGSCTGALSGWMIAHWGGVLGTDSFSVDLAIGLFLMVVLGGITTHWGAVIGALFYVEVPQLLKQFTRYQSVIYGAVLLVVIIALPKGLAGLAESVFRRRRIDSPRSPEAATARGRFMRLLDIRGN